MWFELQETPLAWVDTAPNKFVNELVLDATPDEVFAIFADIDQWPKWFKDIKRGAWDEDGERGVGSRRTVYLRDINVRETILAWDPGKRFAFCVTHASLPLSRNVVEDFRLEATDDGRARLVWTVGYDVRAFVVPFAFIIKMKFRRMFKRALASLDAYVKAQ